ncbi:hypothetical protein CC86DRAFT_370109 [Ophiobolus disseminans]|uniref:PH domain-containing protein n=1 Tax=Ophiobolus disseminans TaxID=1469910 RepID=A0A6A7A2K5_9PLEO|nr:hypothetical protein CC86DRAFT_370109 [Ophiobolus disseminans]
MATETVPPTTATAKRVSRYRSVRRAQEQQTQQQSPPPVPAVPALPPMLAEPEMQAPKDAQISRSMSRYHRRPPTSHATTPAVPALRSNTLPAHPAPPIAQPSPTSRYRAISSPQHASHSTNTAQHRPRTAKRTDNSTSASASSQSRSPRADDSARELLQKERERQRLLKERYDAEARAHREAKQAELDRLESLRREEEEAALLQAQQEAEEADMLRRQKDEQRAEHERGKRLRKAEAQKILQQREDEARKAKEAERERRARHDEEKTRKAKIEAERPRQAPSSSPPVSPPRHDTNFGLFKRRKDDGLTQEAPGEPSRAPRLSLHLGDHEAETIRPGGGGAVLGIDAPTSAVNAGDRRVTVVCGKKRILLPVTPTTTPLDLIKTAATILTEPIDVRTAVMQELFVKVSIVRPLRNYEYVRDVMNSWDADNQNELTIIDSELDGIDQDDLLAYKVPETRPEGMSCFIQYSSRPGKWSKRYLTLRADGQLVLAKNEKVKEKDQENVLTMTDYDIYTVTQKKLARVKPPKKICFAVKSLQKSNIFADESQYVHFFCTNDRNTATMFYKALQQWRSWYLKYQKGEGLKKKAPAQRKLSGGESGPHASSHNRGESVGSHYQLGAFSSLLDLEDFNKKLDSIEVHKPGEFPEDKPLSGLDTRAMHARKKSLRVKQPPPSAFNRSAPALDTSSQNLARQNSTRRSLDQTEEETFASGGLLGRTYTHRQREVQNREQKQNGPFTEGPSLISGMDRLAAVNNDSGLNRSSSVRSSQHKRNSSDLRRTASKRVPGMPEPLIDLTPAYRPPPQHANKGRGYNPGATAGPLVESATSIEEAIKLPPSQDWRARPTTQGRGAHGTYGTGNFERTRSLKGRGEPLAAYTVNNHSGAPDDDREAFTGGLLAQAGYSQGFAPVGRGVMDGSKATGPMIDLREGHQIVPGSLLAALPDSNAPVIDRSAR